MYCTYQKRLRTKILSYNGKRLLSPLVLFYAMNYLKYQYLKSGSDC